MKNNFALPVFISILMILGCQNTSQAQQKATHKAVEKPTTETPLNKEREPIIAPNIAPPPGSVPAEMEKKAMNPRPRAVETETNTGNNSYDGPGKYSFPVPVIRD